MQPSWLCVSIKGEFVMDTDTETMFLVSVFQKANPVTSKPTTAEFLDRFKLEIDRTCNMLKFLGLVAEARSTLGFKPTERLIDIVVDRMIRANTAGNNPVAMIEADCFGWLWHHVTSDLGSEQPGRDEQDEGEQHEDTAEDVVKEDDGPDEYWDAEDDYEEAEDDGSGRQFCCKVFVLLGLLKPGHKRYVPTRLITDLVLDRCFQQLSKNGLNVI
jgi:hypothetical protein